MLEEINLDEIDQNAVTEGLKQNKPKKLKAYKEEDDKLQEKEIKHKEQTERDILGFFINQIDEKKFVKKKKRTFIQKLKDNLGKQQINEKDERVEDQILNQNEFQEIKGNYDDISFGDLVIVFPNPDHKTQIDSNTSVKFKQAQDVYENILSVINEDGITKTQLKREQESFLHAFLSLNDYKVKDNDKDKVKDKDKDKEKDKNKNKSKLKEFKSQNQIVKDKGMNQSQLHRQQTENKNQNQDKPHQNKKKKPMNNRENQENQEITYQKYLEIMSEHNQYIKHKINKDNIDFQTDNKHVNIDPVKELMRVDLKDVSQFKDVEKCLSGGGFLQFEQEQDNPDDFYWICTNGQPKDFLTLIRFTVMVKLCRNANLHTRQFVSQSGLEIFMVVKSSRNVIKQQAEKMKINKQLELGYADLFSLEPCDKIYRPLRLNKYLRDIETLDEKTKLKLQQLEEQSNKNKNNHVQEKESNIRLTYRIIMKWDEEEFRAQMIHKQMEADKYLKVMQRDLNIDLSHEKVELMDESDITREEWETYYIYMEYLIYFMKNVQKEIHTENNIEYKRNQAFLYKLIFRKALGDSNEYWFEFHPNLMRQWKGEVDILLNLWDRIGLPPISPYADYIDQNNEKQQQMWRLYEINEKNQRSEFLNMEKIKITQAIVLKNINVFRMLKQQYCIGFFPIHDPYQLRGEKKDKLFKPLLDSGFINVEEQTPAYKKLRKLFEQMEDEAEASDFDADPLEKEAQFNFLIPWFIPIDVIRDYYGEKIAMYFDFLQFYTKQLWYIGLFGIIAYIIQLYGQQQAKDVINVIFSLTIVMWSTLFIEFWKREQYLFAVQFGQQGFEEDEAERPAFTGKQVRSITNDDLNELFYSPFLRKMKMLFSLCVSFMIIGMVIACVIGIFILKSNLRGIYPPDSFVVTTLPGLLNTIQINIFNTIYFILVDHFNRFENHQILSSYENSLISKTFIFIFVNTFNSFFFISFMNSSFGTLNLCLDQNNNTNCFQVLRAQMTTIFLTTFVMNIPKLAVPFINGILNEKKNQKDENPEVHPFMEIDQKIEKNIHLVEYATNEEVDGTVGDYLEILIQFSFINLFGLAFPLAFFLSFITNIAIIQVNKTILTKLSRRPFPQGAGNIGNWLIIIEIITFFGLFSNAGLIVYTSQSIYTDKQLSFSILIIVFLASKYMIRYLIPDAPESITIINKRHNYINEKVLKVINNIKTIYLSFYFGFLKGLNLNTQHKIIPARINPKIGGVDYQDRFNKLKEYN